MPEVADRSNYARRKGSPTFSLPEITVLHSEETPPACAGALNVLERIDDDLLEGVKKRSELIFSMLEGKPGIKSVSGMGLMIGIETEKDAGEVLALCRERELLRFVRKIKYAFFPLSTSLKIFFAKLSR